MKEITFENYYEKVLGSWIGRVAGDFVGAPVEFKQYSSIKEMYGNITDYPEAIDLDAVNDDEMYEICALIALEKKGINLSAKDIAQEWVNLLYTMNFTAEEIALKNLRNRILPPESGTHKNPYYDAIGAQMRADIWGQITPGCPAMAKHYAELDGCISHSGLGIEGEVYVAVLISQAFFINDIQENITLARNYLPTEEESLYLQMVNTALELYKQFPNDFRDGRRELIRYWDDLRRNKLLKESQNNRRRRAFLKHESQVHVLPNVGIIVLSLLYGAQDKDDPLGKSICIAAMMGLDTDCNCGNIGAILGAQLGANKIPRKWSDPLQNTFSTYVKGYEKWKLTDLAKRVANIGREVIIEKCQKKVKITN